MFYCGFCSASAISKRQYEHPNGERYWMNVCVSCSLKHAKFEVKS